MRTKKAAKMATESKIPAKPSSMAPYFLNLLVEDTQAYASEESNTVEDLSVSTTSSSVNEAGVDDNQSSEDEGESVEEHNKINDSVVPGSAKIELLKERICIFCDKVGSMLVCNSPQCPSSYHQKCLPASPSSDDLGNFYCPHCSYKRAVAENNEAFKKYREAKYALFQFLNGMEEERKKQEAQEAATKEPNPSTRASNEDDAISKIKLEKCVCDFESKENGQDVMNEHGRNIQNHTEAHESALNEPVESHHLDDHESAEMAGYGKESELHKVLTNRTCESPEISGKRGREEEASVHPAESEFTEPSADSLRMAKKADVESDSYISSSAQEPLTKRQKKLAVQQSEMIKLGQLSNFKGNTTSSSDQKSSMEGDMKEEASLHRVESEFTESLADSVGMAKKAGSESDICNADHEPLKKHLKELVIHQSEMIKMGVLSNLKCIDTSSSGKKSSREEGRKEEASFNPIESEVTKLLVDSVGMAKKADITFDISNSDHEPLTKHQKKLVAHPSEMIKLGPLSNLKCINTSSSDKKSSMEEGRKEEGSFHPVESEFTEPFADSVGIAKKADIESSISNSDCKPFTRHQKKLVAQRTEMTKMDRLSNVNGNKASSSIQKSSTEENAGGKCKSSKTRIGVLRCFRASRGHEREEKTTSDSAQSAHMLDSMELPKKTESEKVKETKIKEIHSKPKRVQSFWKRRKAMILSGGRRKKRFWSAEETEMLKEGVLKFSTTTNKNLPWQKILDFGHNVFDKTRTPTDLKDKWRNISAEETPTEK